MTNIGALDIKSTFLDMGAKNKVTGNNQTNFQDTLKNSVKKENESVDSKINDEKPVEKVKTTNKPKVDTSSKKDIVTSKENIETLTSEVQDIEQLTSKIVEMVAKALGVDVKELEAMMKSLKLEPTELLNLENLQALIVAVTGNDNMLQLLAQPKEVTMPITQLISEITALASDEFVQQTVQTESNLKTVTQEKPSVIVPESSVQNPNKADVSTTQTSVPESDAQKGVFTLQELDESINNSTSQKENHSESKNSNTETKTVMTSEELLNNLNKLVDTSLNLNRVENVEQQSTTKYVEIVKQIVDQINVTIKANVTSMEMQLNPESLGRLSLVISSKDGLLKAQFTVSDQTVKQALESQMTQLKDSLSQQGLKIESIEVKLSDLAYNLNQQKQQQQEQQQQKKKASFRVEEGFVQEDDKAIIEGIRKELEIERSTQVDFSA